jgi:hypothetical protein
VTPTVRKQIITLMRQIDAEKDPHKKRELRKALLELVARNPR